MARYLTHVYCIRHLYEIYYYIWLMRGYMPQNGQTEFMRSGRATCY